MIKKVLPNGVKLIYKNIEGEVTSFSIALEAGANSEDGYNLGIAHAVEHMVFKGTKTKSEDYINEKCDELFGFNNAMTNFPYVIYYGTLANEDFKEGLDLYGDIVLNPIFPEEGFNEEKKVILQELDEWKEDLDQYCEDEILFNSFNKRRFKNIIIGTKGSVERITLKEIKDFYENFYVAENIVISVVTPIKFEKVYEIVNNIFNCAKNKKNINFPIKYNYESINNDIFKKEILGFKSAKIRYIFDISSLNIQEIQALKIFNLWFGDGVSSKLYDLIRTKEGLAYEVGSFIKNEKGIKLFNINCSCNKNTIDKVIKLIEKAIEDSKCLINEISDEGFKRLRKRLKLKISLEIERSIVLANRLSIYEIMYQNSQILGDEAKDLIKIDKDLMIKTVNKILKNYSIEILK